MSKEANSIEIKREFLHLFQNILLILGLIYLLLIPLGKITKDQRIGSQEIPVILILFLTSSGLIPRLDNLKFGKDGIEARFQEIEDKEKTKEKNNVSAIESVDLYLSETIKIENLTDNNLEEKILKASPTVLEFIYGKTKEVRKSALKDHKKGLIERTVPIFESLTKSEHRKENHRFFAQLGYALKDQSQPNWQKAKDNFDTAIKLWKQEHKETSSLPPHYCFNWLICAINLENQAHKNQKSEVSVKNLILDRIKCVSQCEALNKSLYNDDSVQEWLKCNQISIPQIKQYKPNKNCYLSNTNEDSYEYQNFTEQRDFVRS